MAEESKSTDFDSWYEIASADPVMQGDVLQAAPLVRASSFDGSQYRFETKSAELVVLTQSCDIAKSAQTTLLLAEVHDYERIAGVPGNDHLRQFKYKEALERGNAVSDFLLPPYGPRDMSWSIVSFRDLAVLPKSMVLGHVAANGGVRLQSPYREYLSQAFARYVMRVGLPEALAGFSRA